MMPRKRNTEEARRYEAMIGKGVERRRREREAPLLCAEAPGLVELSIELTECGQGAGFPDVTFIRRFVLATAPALFLVACGDPLCAGGGHDLSPPVMSALGSQQRELRGETKCRGTVGEVTCTRCVRFVMTAAFDDALRTRAMQGESLGSSSSS